MRPEVLDKLKEKIHWISNPRPSGFDIVHQSQRYAVAFT
jgi:hypothetical protein